MNILLLSLYNYPKGAAGALRQHSFAKILINCNCNVLIAAKGAYDNLTIKQNDGIDYVIFENSNRKYKNNLKKILKKYPKQYDTIIISQLPINAALFIRRYAKKNKINLVYDCVEWYSAQQFKFKWFDLRYIYKTYYNTIYTKKHMKVIAISDYIKKYYDNREINNIRIPVILDIANSNVNLSTKNSKTLTLLYAGSSKTSRKDYIKEMIAGIEKLEAGDQKRIKFNIVGLSTNDLGKILGKSIREICNMSYIKCFGRLSHDRVLELYGEADFSVLIRSSTQRYAKAGFPTKVVESLSNSTPVILNLTSDLHMYLHHRFDCEVVENEQIGSISKAFKNVLYMPNSDIELMGKNARETAEKYFDFRSYKEIFMKFLEGNNGD